VEDDLFWGDEVEYAILETEGEDGAPDRTIKLALVGSEAMAQLNALETSMHNPSQNGCSWHQEFGSWMLEGTPALPYSGYARDLVEVEQNMRRRRARILALLPPNRLAPTTTNFPLLGVLDTPRAPTDDAAVANGAAADQGDAPAGGESGGRSGVGGACLTVPLTWPGGPSSESAQVSDACINPHPRFGTLAANIRKRRGSKVAVRMPLFKDAHTPEFATHDLDCPEVEARAGAGARAAPEQDGGGGGESVRGEPLPFHLEAWGDKWPMVTGDCMAFGMGSCCLQVTFQSRDVHESRFMFDQLAGLSPIMLALSAASPCFNGRLLDTDARWTSISQSVDDRTPQERGLGAEPAGTKEGGMAGGGVRRLSKSRYDSVSCFLSLDTPEAYNDIPCEVDEAARASLLEAGVDPVLARHVAHLFTRDPLVMYQVGLPLPLPLPLGEACNMQGHPLVHAHPAHESPCACFFACLRLTVSGGASGCPKGSIEEIPDDGSRTDHWESLQSTNWQTMRWKPPPAMPASASDAQDPASRDYAHIGWRTEFRSMEVQLTDFENAAYTVFIVLLTRVLLVFDLDLLLPLSKIDANMQRAHARAPVKTQKFWFRKDVTPGACRAPCPQERAACEEASRLKRAQAEAERLAALESGVPVAAGSAGARAEPSEELFEEMSMGEVLGGKGDYFPGLVPLCYAYLDHIKCDRETFKRVDM